MLRSVESIEGLKILAKDGEIGHAYDILFSDADWVARYLVIDTGSWLPGRKLLIPTKQLGEPTWENREFPVQLTLEQVESSPPLSTDEPVSRQHERDIAQYFEWEPYFDGRMPGVTPMDIPAPGPERTINSPGVETTEETGDPHLRSAREITGYKVHAKDAEVGRVTDIIIEDTDWNVRWFVVGTGKWLPGKQVLLSPQWVKMISWGDQEIVVSLNREAIAGSPEYDPTEPINREYEEVLSDYYGRPRYWEK